jgi:MFS family permease
MTMFHALFMGVLPTLLLVWIGTRVRPAANGRQDAVRWLRFLLGTLTLLLVVLVVTALLDSRISSFFFMFLLPTMCGAIAALFLHLFSGGIVWSRNLRTLPLFLVVLGLFIGIGLAGEPAIPVYIILGGILIAFIWRVWSWVGRWFLVAYAVMVLLLLVSIRTTDTHRPLIESPVWLANIVQIAISLMPGMAIIVAARLVHAGQVDDKPVDWRKAILAFVLIPLILLLVGYQIGIASIWDVATDGLGGIFFWGLTSVVGIASAIQLAWSLPGKRKLAALAFAVVVPVSMMVAHRIGTYGPHGQWGMLPTMVTEQRAEAVNRAIQRYHKQNGDYPRALTDLTPLYLVYIPNPLIIPGQTWCYEGGHNYYRLGYVYRQFFSSPASVRVHATVGKPSVSAWGCEDEAAKYPAPPGYYGP